MGQHVVTFLGGKLALGRIAQHHIASDRVDCSITMPKVDAAFRRLLRQKVYKAFKSRGLTLQRAAYKAVQSVLAMFVSLMWVSVRACCLTRPRLQGR